MLMSILILELIGLLCMCKIIIIIITTTIIILFISILLVYNTFLKKLKHLSIVLCPSSSSSALHNKNIKSNIFRKLAYDSIMCGYIFFFGYVNFMLKRKTLTEHTNLFHQITLIKMMI